MAQPTQFIPKYVGSAYLKKSEIYTDADFAATGNILQIKTADVSVSLNGNPMFKTTFDDTSYIETGVTYMFDRDCQVAIISMVEIV